MILAKVTVVCEVEYEVNPEFYPEGLTVEEMVQMDIENTDCLDFWFDDENAKITVSGQIIQRF